MDLSNIFDKTGNFKLKYFDPYCVANEKEGHFRSLIFDKSGNLHDHLEEAIPSFVDENSLSPWCDAVICYHAQQSGNSTKGKYPAIYYWR
jgi:hypothetical protein